MRPIQLLPVVRCQAAQREPFEIASAREQHDQQHREQEAGDGVSQQ